MALPSKSLHLSQAEVEQIVGFLGYGNLSAPVWFIGKEEGLGGMTTADVDWNLKERAAFSATMDLYEAHLLLKEKGERIDIEKKETFTPVWEYTAKFMRGCNKQTNWKDLVPARDYIRFELGRSESSTFLTELSPIPSGDAGEAKKFMAWFKSEHPALYGKLLQRKKELKASIAAKNPPLVICYSIPKADDFAWLLGIAWCQVGKDLYASADARRLLLPFFGGGAIGHNIMGFALDFLSASGTLPDV